MAKRTPDFQKQEAKNSLWSMDGQHVKKKSRNKGKGRGKDKRLIETELREPNPEVLLSALQDKPHKQHSKPRAVKISRINKVKLIETEAGETLGFTESEGKQPE